jgi:hypothetical protein
VRKYSRLQLITVGIGVLVIIGLVATTQLTGGLFVRNRPATITEISGTVLFSPVNDSQWTTAKVGMQLKRGDQLMTQAPDGDAMVQFDDGNIGFRMQSDSLLTMAAGWNKVLQAGTGGVYLNHGHMVAATRKGVPTAETAFTIDTDAAHITTEGTRLIVQALKDDLTTRVSSLEGAVRVRAKLAEATLLRPDAQRSPERETVVTDNETLIVYVEPANNSAPVYGASLGRVVNSESGDGNAGAVVQVVGRPEFFVLSDEEGYFEIPDAAYNSELALVGTTTALAEELELRPSVGQISGRAVDAISGMGIANVQIVPIGYRELATETKRDGSFVIQELPRGTHSLVFSNDEYVVQVIGVVIDREVRVSLPDSAIEPKGDPLVPWVWLPTLFGQYP